MNKYKDLIEKYKDNLDELMLLNEIKGDITERLFDDKKISKLIHKALSVANDLYIKYKDEDINQIIKQNGFVLEEVKQNPYYFSRLDDKRKILSTTDKYDILEGKLEGIKPKKLRQISIAHEFIHVLEFRNEIKIEEFELLFVEKKLFFGIVKRNRTSMIFELIAHQFAKLKTGISFNPKLLDYVYLVESEKITIDDLEERLKMSNEYYEENIK